jgi:hypothetical protein
VGAVQSRVELDVARDVEHANRERRAFHELGRGAVLPVRERLRAEHVLHRAPQILEHFGGRQPAHDREAVLAVARDRLVDRMRREHVSVR